MTNVDTVAGRVIPRGREVVHDRTPPHPPARAAVAGDVSSPPSLRDAHAILAIHRPDATGLCRGCLALARLAGSRCPIALQAARTVRLLERATSAG